MAIVAGFVVDAGGERRAAGDDREDAGEGIGGLGGGGVEIGDASAFELGECGRRMRLDVIFEIEGVEAVDAKDEDVGDFGSRGDGGAGGGSACLSECFGGREERERRNERERHTHSFDGKGWLHENLPALRRADQALPRIDETDCEPVRMYAVLPKRRINGAGRRISRGRVRAGENRNCGGTRKW